MALGDRQLTGKWHFYEESIRTPLIIKLPKNNNFSAPKEINELSLNIDLMPTILDFAGCLNKQTYNFKDQGVSLKKILIHEKEKIREFAYFEILYDHQKIPKCLGIRTKIFKYMFFIKEKDECLFNLETDPLESKNLIANKDFKNIRNNFRKLIKGKYQGEFNF